MLILFLVFFSSIIGAKDISLYIGEKYSLNAEKIKKIIITDSNIVEAKQISTKIILKAKTIGNVKVKIITNNKKSKTINISVIQLISPQVNSINKLLKTIKGVKTKYIKSNSLIKVYGFVDNIKDYKLISKLAKEYKFLSTSVRLQQIDNKEDKIISDFLELGAYDIHISKTAGIFFIEASVRTEEVKEKIHIYVQRTLKTAKINIKLIPYQVDIDVKIIETTKDEAKNYGLELPNSLSFSRHSIMSPLDLEATLHFGQMKGKTKVLYNPSLTTSDRNTANFHAGGSIPIKLDSQFSSEVIWKKYGVMLKFTPTFIRTNILKLDISSEFSSLGGTTKDNSIPSIVTRQVETSVTVEEGKAIVISGLIQKMSEHSVSGLPILSDIPLLSAIFSKNTKSKTKTELLIVVTPHLRLKYDDRLIDQELDALLIETIQKR